MKPAGDSAAKSEWRMKPIPFRDPYAMMETNGGAVLGAPGQRGGVRMAWTFQLLCEFELDGKRYTVTPGYWSTFISERRLQKFLDKVISPDGACQLWVNPKNPLQAELYANDSKDFLLHEQRKHAMPNKRMQADAA